MHDKIIIKGAREHNLKNIDLEIPREKMVVFTGLSGSGKSSLAFDTIFAEGQRRYIESLSAYARQFLGRLDKPDVDDIEGLSPAISIDQKSHSANPRSTVATITEIYDYLRVLFARAGKPFCPSCGREIKKLTTEEIVDIAIDISNKNESKKNMVILAPVVRGRKGEYYQMLYDFLNAGFTEVRVDGKYHSLRERLELSRYKVHTIELVVDRIPAGMDFKEKDNRLRLVGSDRIRTEIRQQRRHGNHGPGGRAFGAVHLPTRRILVPGNRAAPVFIQQPVRRVSGMPWLGNEGHLVGGDLSGLRGQAAPRGKFECPY